MYIQPILYVHSNFSDAQEFYENFGPGYYWGTKNPASIKEIVQGKRNLIVGEPGVGKTELIRKIQERLKEDGVNTTAIGLRESNPISRITDFLGSHSRGTDALLLDGLDEVQASLFPDVLEKLHELDRLRPDLQVYLSSRWLFIKRHSPSFSGYRFITVSPFTRDQVRQYLMGAGRSAAEADNLISRVLSFEHNMLVIQIPRYLSLLVEFLKTHQVPAADELSRNELFEYFIYSKLEIEDKRLNADKRAITKRLLEKLALVMEIYQANAIRKDELMTFFDDLDSDLKVAALSQLDLQVLFDNTLLKDNHDSIEFDNTEFQEYLAAKEIKSARRPFAGSFCIFGRGDQRVSTVVVQYPDFPCGHGTCAVGAVRGVLGHPWRQAG